MERERELAKLQNDFSSISKLIGIMGRASEEHSQFLDGKMLRDCHVEMAYALNFVSNVLESKSNELLSLIGGDE